MQTKKTSLVFFFGIIFFMGCKIVYAERDSYYVIPFDVDPPIMIDGNLEDWAGIPAIALDRKEQVSYGAANWTDINDLSGKIYLAYRYEGLYIAAEIVDDNILQPYVGKETWKGDHLGLYMDMLPDLESWRLAFGRGQVQILFSPGTVGKTYFDKEFVKPHIYIVLPEGASTLGSDIAAKKIPKGYVIEAYIPFTCMNIEKVKMNQDASFEIAVSDSDVMPAEQQTLITYRTEKWNRSRGRMTPLVFGDGNGRGSLPIKSISVLKETRVTEGNDIEISFDAPPAYQNKEPYLFFKARIDSEKPIGYQSEAISIYLNGTKLPADSISNKPQKVMCMTGNEITLISDDGSLTIPRTPSYVACDAVGCIYRLIESIKACEFEFNISELIKEGKNKIVFYNLSKPPKSESFEVIIENLEIRNKMKAKPVVVAPAPTGSLPVLEPRKDLSKTYSNLLQKSDSIEFKLDDEEYSIKSRFTTPDGNWYHDTTKFYIHTRKIIEHNEWIEIHDTFKNLTNQNIPIMQEHSCLLGKNKENIWLACERVDKTGETSQPLNPTIFASNKESGIGMLPLNDEFRVHANQSSSDNVISLSDREFVLKAGSEYTAEWAVVPVKSPDIWDFINVTRRLLDANFTLKYMFAFILKSEPVWVWNDKVFKNFIELKSANFVTQIMDFAKYNGKNIHGLAFQKLIGQHCNFYTDFHKRLKRLFPDGSIKHAIYYHCYLDVMEENAERFKDCRKVDSAGNQITYSGSRSKLYVPTLENDWGKEIGKGIDIRIKDVGCDAIYWDEYNQSKGKYTYNMWDGCSADIDPETFKIIRLKGAVHLLSLDFLHYHMKRLIDSGVPLVCNGAPMSRTLAKLKFQNFVETGNINRCYETILHSPIALGDHITELTEKDAYGVMLKALDRGCLYSWYRSVEVYPTHKTLTEHMFPFTPIELHSGYVIGKERIITNRSGLFGWGDNSEFKTYVYDREGRITDGKEAKNVIREGKTYAEIRIPQGYSVAVVRSGVGD
ncbi:MAG: hypothetical protein A2Y10_02425 [Planctomycetes bacterium GWF2_41_51]|nr:MAG: hypothetical protein A2Y10_02425 [Planctomycetes bacterium GWF2_41_51]HBG27275.1 hypothetical protein [Phycisphaerales bacterium]